MSVARERRPLQVLDLEEGGVEIRMPGFLPAGMNGDRGPGFRASRWKAREARDQIRELIQFAGRVRRIKGPVSIAWVRYCLHPMDWDNFGAAFKFVGDALEALGYIENDSPHVVVGWHPEQVRVRKRAHQGTVVRVSPAGGERGLAEGIPPWAKADR